MSKKLLINYNRLYNIKDDKFYNIVCFHGDPEAAIVVGYEYMPDEYIHSLEINENGNIRRYYTKLLNDKLYLWDHYMTLEQLKKTIHLKYQKIKTQFN